MSLYAALSLAKASDVEVNICLNIRIILDGVFNHTGINFFAFQDILRNEKNSKYLDWYFITKFPVKIKKECYECVGAYPYMPKLNTANLEVRNMILKIMNYWINEFGIDGWRLDVADEIEESVWNFARVLLKDKYPEILLLGETWGNGIRLLNGTQMDSAMNYVFRDAVRAYIAEESIDAQGFEYRIEKMLSRYPDEVDDVMYNLIDSHDTERFMFLCKDDVKKMSAAVVLQLMMKGSPAIYYGDEVGITGDNDPDCRRCMVWGEDEQNLKLKKIYMSLIKLRKETSCISTGNLAVNFAEGKIFGFIRFNENREEVITIVNLSNKEVEIKVPVLYWETYKGIFNDDNSYNAIQCNGNGFRNYDMWKYERAFIVKIKSMESKIFKGGR